MTIPALTPQTIRYPFQRMGLSGRRTLSVSLKLPNTLLLYIEGDRLSVGQSCTAGGCDVATVSTTLTTLGDDEARLLRKLDENGDSVPHPTPETLGLSLCREL
jgi:hypothetical protein